MIIPLEILSGQSRIDTRVGFICGSYDLGPHAGHIQSFRDAKQTCNYLIVGLHINPSTERPGLKHKPVETTFERWTKLSSVQEVDYVIPYETEADLFNLLTMIRPKYRFLDTGYKGKDFTGHHLTYIQNIFLHREHHLSSSFILERCKNVH